MVDKIIAIIHMELLTSKSVHPASFKRVIEIYTNRRFSPIRRLDYIVFSDDYCLFNDIKYYYCDPAFPDNLITAVNHKYDIS